jgi:hypothetical protein
VTLRLAGQEVIEPLAMHFFSFCEIDKQHQQNAPPNLRFGAECPMTTARTWNLGEASLFPE